MSSTPDPLLVVKHGQFIVNMLLPIMTKKIKTREQFLSLWLDEEERRSNILFSSTHWMFVERMIKDIVGSLDYDLLCSVRWFVYSAVKVHYELEYCFSFSVRDRAYV